jgi:hypothetical protein
MSTIVRILIGLALVGIGSYMVIKTRKMMNFFGRIPWADAKLGGGGTAMVYKFIGIIFILAGFLWATNLWNAFINATLGGLLIR